MDARPESDQKALDRIEREVEGGNTDLSDLGFWRVVRRLKVNPALAARWADAAGRIDRTAFERRVRPRFPVWVGNALLGSGTAVLAAAVPLSVAVARRTGPDSVVAGALALVSATGLSVTVHDLAHWAAGRAVGIRFLGYFLDGPFRIQPGLKTEYASYLRASPGGRAFMHAAGAVASKVAPFAAFTAVYLPHRAAGFALFPAWSLWGILAFGAVQVLTDAVWSTKSSDWKRVRRELRLRREAGAARS